MILQVCDPTTNNFVDWVTVKGLIRFRIVRSAGSRPSTLVAYVSANSAEEDPNAVRFWPFQGIRVVETDIEPHTDRTVPGINDVMYFAGKIDNVYLKEDFERGRVWEIQARCWLSVLQDNTINDGRWVNGTNALGGTNTRKSGVTASSIWKPKYSEKYREDTDLFPYGEYRYNIIWDLCMNVVPSFDTSMNDNLLGIIGFHPNGGLVPGIKDADYPTLSFNAPNSAPIQVSFTDKDKSILSVIQQLANSDPWCDGPNGTTLANWYIDASVLARDPSTGIVFNFPKGIQSPPSGTRRGIGGDLQMQMRTVRDGGGRTAEYVARGWHNAGFHLYYGKKQAGRESTKATAIAEIDFGRDGLDTYSSASLSSNGYDSAQVFNSQGQSGTNVYSDMKNTWDPKNGKFRVQRNKRVELPGLKTDLSGLRSGEKTASEARLSLDSAAATVISNLASSNGGIYRGSVTIAGRPKNPKTKLPVRPAEIVKLHIPHLGITWPTEDRPLYQPDTNCDFIIEQWSYEWPDERTVIELTRQLPTLLSKAMYNAFLDMIDHTGWDYISPWAPVWLVTSLGSNVNAGFVVNEYEQTQMLVANSSTVNSAIDVSKAAEVGFSTWDRAGGAKGVNVSFKHNLNTKNIEYALEFGIWDGFAASGTYYQTGGSSNGLYHPFQETIGRISTTGKRDPTSDQASQDSESTTNITFGLPERIYTTANLISESDWNNLLKSYANLPGGSTKPPPPYPTVIKRTSDHLLIRIKIRKK